MARSSPTRLLTANERPGPRPVHWGGQARPVAGPVWRPLSRRLPPQVSALPCSQYVDRDYRQLACLRSSVRTSRWKSSRCHLPHGAPVGCLMLVDLACRNDNDEQIRDPCRLPGSENRWGKKRCLRLAGPPSAGSKSTRRRSQARGVSPSGEVWPDRPHDKSGGRGPQHSRPACQTCGPPAGGTGWQRQRAGAHPVGRRDRVRGNGTYKGSGQLFAVLFGPWMPACTSG